MIFFFKMGQSVCVCLCVCVLVCSCLFTGLTTKPVNLIFGMHTYIRSDCVIGYMIASVACLPHLTTIQSPYRDNLGIVWVCNKHPALPLPLPISIYQEIVL